VAYACKTWDRRLSPARPAPFDRDCEPGKKADGSPTNALACRDNVCTDVRRREVQDASPSTPCQDKTFGASAYCDGRACPGAGRVRQELHLLGGALHRQPATAPPAGTCRCAEEFAHRRPEGLALVRPGRAPRRRRGPGVAPPRGPAPRPCRPTGRAQCARGGLQNARKAGMVTGKGDACSRGPLSRSMGKPPACRGRGRRGRPASVLFGVEAAVREAERALRPFDLEALHLGHALAFR
jgi:hypothetical protein